MLLPITAENRTISEDDARVLDDEFFRSDPNAYFRSRIASMLSASLESTISPTPETSPEFFAALNLEPAGDVLQFHDEDRRTQNAVDALALRQHVAESLVRFLHAIVAAEPRHGDAPSTWMAGQSTSSAGSSRIEATSAMKRLMPSPSTTR